jgi:hypothetical protein
VGATCEDQREQAGHRDSDPLERLHGSPSYQRTCAPPANASVSSDPIANATRFTNRMIRLLPLASYEESAIGP